MKRPTLHRLGILLGLACSLSAATGCVQSRCTRNSECPAGEVCLAATGTCSAPECTFDSQCVQGRICEDFSCIVGCRTTAECGPDETCFGNRCVPNRAGCLCPAAPRFCGKDLNAASPTGGKEVCVPDGVDDGMALMFGSVACGHCQDLLASLRKVRDELKAEGEKPVLGFVQLGTFSPTASEVTQAMSGQDVPVFQDTEAQGIWKAYAADWYHLVIVNRRGCLAAHFGPLAPADVSGGQHEAIRKAWKDAMHAECTPAKPEAVETADPGPDPAVSEPAEPGPEPRPDPAEVVDLPELADMPDLGDVADVLADAWDFLAGKETGGPDIPAELAAEETPDQPDDVPGPAEVLDVAGEAWVEPFTLADVCQVVEGTPIAVGEPVRHFLCKDLNPSSGSFGQPVSEFVLKEQVWIAYFGSCT